MMVKNIRIDFGYDGSNFHGYQKQNDLRTVQGELERAIRFATGKDHRLISSGRTDVGVHGIRQVANFLDVSVINPSAMKYHLRNRLPDDILIYETKEVSPSFNSRFDCKSRTYRYILNTSKDLHPIFRNYKGNVTYSLDYEKMVKASKLYIGIHDFNAFSKENEGFTTIRQINEFKISREDEDIIFEINGNSFLRNQIRIMVGTLIEVARGRLVEDDIKNALIDGKREDLGITAPSEGLYLKEVFY